MTSAYQFIHNVVAKLTANAAADTLPDLSQAYNSWLIPYLDKVVHLDDFVANDYDNYEDIMEGYREETSQFGFINAMPFNKSTYVYFYNKTMFLHPMEILWNACSTNWAWKPPKPGTTC